MADSWPGLLGLGQVYRGESGCAKMTLADLDSSGFLDFQARFASVELRPLATLGILLTFPIMLIQTDTNRHNLYFSIFFNRMFWPLSIVDPRSIIKYFIYYISVFVLYIYMCILCAEAV